MQHPEPAVTDRRLQMMEMVLDVIGHGRRTTMLNSHHHTSTVYLKIPIAIQNPHCSATRPTSRGSGSKPPRVNASQTRRRTQTHFNNSPR